MEKQPEALRLAEALEDFWGQYGGPEEPHELNAAAELRRLHAQRDELLAALEKVAGFTMSQFMGPHDMALECVTVASAAIAKATGQ